MRLESRDLRLCRSIVRLRRRVRSGVLRRPAPYRPCLPVAHPVSVRVPRIGICGRMRLRVRLWVRLMHVRWLVMVLRGMCAGEWVRVRWSVGVIMRVLGWWRVLGIVCWLRRRSRILWVVGRVVDGHVAIHDPDVEQ